jgi:hypothetical protein
MPSRKPLPALRQVYERLEDSTRELDEAPELYIQETLSRDLADLLRDFPKLPEEVNAAVVAAQKRATEMDVEGARKMVRRAMVACRTSDG